MTILETRIYKAETEIKENTDNCLKIAVVLAEHQDKILFLRFSTSYPEIANLLSLPGGKLEIGETPMEAAIREFKEETGLHLNFVEFGCVQHKPAKNILLHVYTAAFKTIPKVLLNAREHSEFLWLTRDDLEKREDVIEGAVELVRYLENIEFEFFENLESIEKDTSLVVKSAAVCVKVKDKYLLLQYNDKKPIFPMYFGFPGGKMDEGEEPFDAAKRELFEETGIKVEELKFKGVALIDYKRINFQVIVCFYFVEFEEFPNVEIDPKEHCAFQWMDLNELLKTEKKLGGILEMTQLE